MTVKPCQTQNFPQNQEQNIWNRQLLCRGGGVNRNLTGVLDEDYSTEQKSHRFFSSALFPIQNKLIFFRRNFDKLLFCTDLRNIFEGFPGKNFMLLFSVYLLQVLRRIRDEIDNLNSTVLMLIDQVRHCLQRLEEIALKPNPLSTVDYIDLLIQTEENEAKPGWKDRIKSLQEIRKQAEIITDVKTGKYDPFPNHKHIVKRKPRSSAVKKASSSLKPTAANQSSSGWKFW